MILITARLYQHEARKVATKSLKVKIVNERHQIFEFAKKLLSNRIREATYEPGSEIRVGFEEDDLNFGEYQELNNPGLSICSKPGLGYVDKPGLKLIPIKNLIEDLRIIKTAAEIKKIEMAQIISQKTFGQLIKTLKVGQTEKEIAEKLRLIIKSLGAQGLAFESIVASGPNAGLPHYITSKKKIKRGEVLLLDFGAKYQNYLADLSRTVFIGKAKDYHANIYNHVRKAQLEALTKIRHGVKLAEAYHFVNDHFKKHNLEKYFIHGLGHGIGLEIHERPYLRPTRTQARLVPNRQAGLDDEELKENMVFSIEPGLYFPWGGVRIEDLVVIKNGRSRVLGKLTDEIIEI